VTCVIYLSHFNYSPRSERGSRGDRQRNLCKVVCGSAHHLCYIIGADICTQMVNKLTMDWFISPHYMASTTILTSTWPCQLRPTPIDYLGTTSIICLPSFLLSVGLLTTVDHWVRYFPVTTRCACSTLFNPHPRKAWCDDGLMCVRRWPVGDAWGMGVGQHGEDWYSAPE
jgi:hypothetical protein